MGYSSNHQRSIVEYLSASSKKLTDVVFGVKLTADSLYTRPPVPSRQLSLDTSFPRGIFPDLPIVAHYWPLAPIHGRFV